MEHRVNGSIVAQLVLRDGPLSRESIDLSLHAVQLVSLLSIQLFFILKLVLCLSQIIDLLLVLLSGIPALVLFRTATCDEGSFAISVFVFVFAAAVIPTRSNLGLFSEERILRLFIKVIEGMILNGT